MVMSTKFTGVSKGSNEIDLSNANVHLACFEKLSDAATLYSLAERMTIAKFHVERLNKSGARMRVDIPVQKVVGDGVFEDTRLELDLNLFKISFAKDGVYDKIFSVTNIDKY